MGGSQYEFKYAACLQEITVMRSSIETSSATEINIWLKKYQMLIIEKPNEISEVGKFHRAIIW